MCYNHLVITAELHFYSSFQGYPTCHYCSPMARWPDGHKWPIMAKMAIYGHLAIYIYIFGDFNKFYVMPNLSVSNSCLLTMLVGILCDVSPICQSLRSAHSMDSTGNGGSRSKVLRNLHIVRHQVSHLYDCMIALQEQPL